MLKNIFKLKASDIKIVERYNDEKTINSMYMTYNQGGFFPIIIPPTSKNECIEGYSCDRLR